MSMTSAFKQVKCVTLDLDDTLWPVEPTIVRAEQALYDWIQQNYPRIAQQYTLDDMTAQRNELARKRDDIAHDVTQLRHCALEELAVEFGYDASLAKEGLTLFRHFRDQVEPYEHSEVVLSYLQQHYTLGAITNGNAQLHNISIGRFFDFVVTAEHAGVSKPHPEIFVLASEQADVALSEIVHVGDSPQADVIGALRAGCKAIWFNQHRKAWPGGQVPNHVVHCLSELPEVLKF